MLGSFGWRIVRQDKDSVIVTQAPRRGPDCPSGRGDQGAFPADQPGIWKDFAGGLERAESEGKLPEQLGTLGLDEAATEHAAGFIRRQIQATGGLPDDRTIIVEHFRDSTGSHQVMVHALFGRRVNAPLSLLVQRAAVTMTGDGSGCVDEEEGFLLYPYGKEQLPEGLLYQIDPERVRPVLESASAGNASVCHELPLQRGQGPDDGNAPCGPSAPVDAAAAERGDAQLPDRNAGPPP